jgi:uncharacterized membrane protein YphA (DoxX/SURF4 family)
VIIGTLAVRWLLAVVLIVAAVAKLGRPKALSEAISRYGFLPEALILPAAIALPAAELLFGILLAVGILVAPTAIACAGLFGMFAVAVALSLARGRRFACGCGVGTDTEISWSHVGRSTVLIGLSMLVAVEPAALAINAGRVRGAPGTDQLVAVPLGVLLLCVSWRMAGALRDTISILNRPWRSRASVRTSTVEA